jgi:hypothetical protein
MYLSFWVDHKRVKEPVGSVLKDLSSIMDINDSLLRDLRNAGDHLKAFGTVALHAITKQKNIHYNALQPVARWWSLCLAKLRIA